MLISVKFNDVSSNLDASIKDKMLTILLSAHQKKSVLNEMTKKSKQSNETPKPLQSHSSLFHNSVMKLKKLEDYKEIYKAEIKNDPTIEAELTTLYNFRTESLTKVKQDSDFEKAAKDYFTNIYPTRSTVGQSSNYTWKRLDDEQLQKLVDKYKKF